MVGLANLKCEAVRRGDTPLNTSEIAELQPQVADWELLEIEGIKRLRREFAFKDFQQALSFTNKVGEIAEVEDHHPALLTEWGKVTVTWWTHVIKGLHKNDFIMAAKTDAILRFN